MLKKRFASLFLALAMVLGLSGQALAVEKTQYQDIIETSEEQNFSEYDYYVIIKELQSHSNADLLNAGWSLNEIEELREISFESALRERAALDEATLKNYGYTREEIILLKQIDAGIMPLNETSFRALLAECDGDFELAKDNNGNTLCNNTRWTFIYEWEWTKAPLFMGLDSAAVSWGAYNSNSVWIDTLLVSAKGEGNYYHTVSGAVQKQALTRDQDADFNGAKYNFHMGVDSVDGSWLKSGTIQVTVKTATGTTSSIHYMKLCGLYGHAKAVITASPGISAGAGDFSWGFSFNPSIRVDTHAVAKYAYYTNQSIPREDISGEG